MPLGRFQWLARLQQQCSVIATSERTQLRFGLEHSGAAPRDRAQAESSATPNASGVTKPKEQHT